MNKLYKTLFLIFGILSAIILIFSLFLAIGSIGHNWSPWGIRVGFNESRVSIEPNIECLNFADYWSQGAYNLLIAKGNCTGELKVNGAKLETFSFNWIDYRNNAAYVNVNNLTIIANQENNYIFIFPVEYENKTSIVKVPVFIENGTINNLKTLVIFFSPVIILVLLIIVYKTHSKKNLRIKKKKR